MSQKRVLRMYQSGSAKLMLPNTHSDMMEAVILNTSGGMTDGDSLNIAVKAQDCALVMTTQTAERVYRSGGTKPAKVNINLSVSDTADLHWLPQETIVFNNSKFDRTLTINLSSCSNCLIAETIVLGREAMGENICDCKLFDNWRVFRDDNLFHAESIRLSNEVKKIIAAPAGGNGARLLSTIFYVGHNLKQVADRVARLSKLISSNCALSCWDDRLVVRLVSAHSTSARKDIERILLAIRQQPLPRVWQTEQTRS
ncbi:MAG: urease accessory protein UreD [Pseudomonadota bacterium]|nr:urease accessory protein UreD [Pseudomonadota bacterium]